MEEDCRIRKAIFSRKARETLEDLHFALPEQKLKAVKKLNCDHFGQADAHNTTTVGEFWSE